MLLQTERLDLRAFTDADLPAVCAVVQDPEVMYAYEHAFSDEEARAWLSNQLCRYREDGFGLWAVEERATGEIVGQCGITKQFWRGTPVHEVGYLFAKAHWHRGFATEAAAACRDFAFDALGAKEVYAFIRTNNFASQRVAERLGMHVKDTVVKQYYGMDMPHRVYSITCSEMSDKRAPLRR